MRDPTDEAAYNELNEMVSRAYVRGEPVMLICATSDDEGDCVTTHCAGMRHFIERRGMLEIALDTIVCTNDADD